MGSKGISKETLTIYMNNESECEESESDISDEGEDFGWVDDSFEVNVELPETSESFFFIKT